MKNQRRYFYSRKFIKSYKNRPFLRFIWKYLSKRINFEVVDIEELRSLDGIKKIPAFLSRRSSVVELFIINSFFMKNNIPIPSHSFGPKTTALHSFSEIWRSFISRFSGKPLHYSGKIRGLYIPLEDQEFFKRDPAWAYLIPRISKKHFYAVPVTTLWNKASGKKRKNWLFKHIGKYNLWSGFREILLLIFGQRKLTVRIGLAREIEYERYSQHLFHKLYEMIEDEKRNIVGVSLKNWLEMRNETLMKLDISSDIEREQAEECLKKIETRYSPVMTDIMSGIVRKGLNMIFSRLIYSQKQITMLRRFAAKSGITLVFVPTHKSYLDHLVLFNLLYSEKITLPLAVAGENLSFFPLGKLLKRWGIFFIKRRMEDKLYRTVFSTYLETVVCSGYDIEFYIEGGRSRSGRVRYPRRGVLQMLSEIRGRSGNRTYVVPVSITYEKLKEIEEFEKETHKGKEAEKKNFFKKIMSLFRARYGPVYINFASPVYLSGKWRDNFPEDISFLLEQQSYISFSSIFAVTFLYTDGVTVGNMIERMKYTVSLFSSIPGINMAPALERLSDNVPKLMRIMAESGKISTVVEKKVFFKINNRAKKEFCYHKNGAAFVLAHFFANSVLTKSEESFPSEYLSFIIRGYRHSTKIASVIAGKELEKWFIKAVNRYFEPYFRLVFDSLKIFEKEKEKIVFKSTSHAVRFLKQKLVGEPGGTMTVDDLYDTVLFLKKKNVLSDSGHIDGKKTEKKINIIDTLLHEVGGEERK